MKDNLRVAFKVFFFSFIVLLIQTSLVTDLFPVPVNLVFCTILVFASYLSLVANLTAGISLCVLSSMLFFNSSIYWVYPMLSYVAYKINPSQIPDKFLICILYTIGFTPIFELFSTSSLTYSDRAAQAILVNIVTVVPLFLITKLIFRNPLYHQF